MTPERIAPSRIPYFFWTLLPTLLIWMFASGLSNSPQWANGVAFIAVFSVWWIIVARQLILNKGGLNIDDKGISYREYGNPDKAFDLSWEEIAGFEVRRWGLFRALCIKLKGRPKPTVVTTAGSRSVDVDNVVMNRMIDAISSAANSSGGAYREIYWLNLSPTKLKALLDRSLLEFTARAY